MVASGDFSSCPSVIVAVTFKLRSHSAGNVGKFRFFRNGIQNRLKRSGAGSDLARPHPVRVAAEPRLYTLSESRLPESRLSESRLSESRLSESRLSESRLPEPGRRSLPRGIALLCVSGENL